MSESGYLAAAVQLSSGADEEANWERARALIERAAGYGARLVATPENTNFLGPHAEKVRRAEPLDGPTCRRFADLAARLRIHLLLGSFNEATPPPAPAGDDQPRRCRNTSVLFDPDGETVAVYRKIHLFDVDVSNELRFLESETVEPGTEVVVAATPLGRLGLSVCYDLRFPELYRRLVEQGAEVLMIPSAFTLTTGKDHWLALVRARAIESQAWVVAPGQYGRHDDEGAGGTGLRQSWGHSLIVDPWGHPVAMAADGTGLALAEIDLGAVERVRRAMPVQQHRRF